MPILSKGEYKALRSELFNRWEALIYHLESRDLKSKYEGVKKRGSFWRDPDQMCVTHGDSTDLRLCIDDFKTILAELRRNCK